MKKLKSILLLLLSCLFVAVFAFAGCSSSGSDDSGSDSTSTSDSTGGDSTGGDSTGGDSTGGDSTGDDSSGDTSSKDYNTMLESISVDTTNAQVSFNVGDAFSYAGIVVTATTSVNSITSTSTVTGYTVDSSEYDGQKVGTYTIYVSYALESEPYSVQYAEYDVTVSSQLPAYANMSMTYSGDQQYSYSTSGVAIDLSSSKLTVTSYIGEDSTDLTEATVTDYTLYYSVNGGEETAVTNSSITATETGVYSVYAVKDYSVENESMEMRAQLLFYVVDTASSLAYNNDGTTSYSYGATDIGSDWTYTVTFASGKTETISYSDVTIEASSSSGSQTATVTYVYSYTGIQNGEVTTVSNTLTASVSYTMAEASATSITEFMVATAGSADGASSTTFDANAQIATNDVFTITSLVATTYSVGASYGNISGTNKSGQDVSFTDMNDDTVVPDQGIRCSNITQSESVGVYSITAKSACTIQVYVTYANEGFSSNKAGTVWYNVNNAETNTDVLTYDKSTYKRGAVATVSVTLAAGDTLVIGALATESGALWLWGAQAKAV